MAAALVAAILFMAVPGATAESAQRALLRLHVTSFANIQGFSETDWDVLISASGKMQGFATCGCANSLACSSEVWTTVTNTAQLSPAQLNTLRAALGIGRIGVLPSCSYVPGPTDPSIGGTYELTWYGGAGPQGFSLRENVITVSLGAEVTPGCSQASIDLFQTIDDFVVDVLGFPLTNAPVTPHPPRPDACRLF